MKELEALKVAEKAAVTKRKGSHQDSIKTPKKGRELETWG